MLDLTDSRLCGNDEIQIFKHLSDSLQFTYSARFANLGINAFFTLICLDSI